VRIQKLHLARFGPFTDQKLDLAVEGPGGLHIVYGPNEAGKSTSLRAVTGLLFGLPQRTEDAHLHPASDLRLGAVLERRVDGEPVLLDVVRHKRRKHPLTDGDGKPLEETALDPFLLGVTRVSFQNRFALDGRQLELGAKALLSGAEEGLFAAGTAGAGAAQILFRLEEEQAALYRPRGQKYVLNQLLEQLREAEKHLRLSERPAEKWQEQKRAYELKTVEVARIEARRSQLRTELSRKNRLGSMLTDVARLSQAEEELAGLGQTPLLPSESVEERTRAAAEERDAAHEAHVHAGELRLLHERVTALGEPSSLELVEDERLSVLRNQLGSELKALADLPKRSAKLDQLTELLTEQLRALGRPQADPDELLAHLGNETHLRALATEHGQVEADVLQLRRSAVRLAQEQEDIRRRSIELREQARLEDGLGVDRDTLLRARERLPAIRARADLARQATEARADAARLAQELDLVRLTAPVSGELLDDLLAERHEQDRRRQELEQERTALVGQQAESEARRAALDSALDLPSEEQLRALRAERDALLGAGPWPEPDEARFRRLVEAVEGADYLADRLRREAVRVSELLALEMDVAAATARLTTLDARTLELEQASVAWAARLATAFSALRVPPTDAATARQAQTRWARWAGASERAAELEREVEHLEREERELRARLAAEGVTLLESVPIDGVVARAEALLQARSRRDFALDELDKELRASQRLFSEERAALEAAEARFGAWSGEWQKATSELGYSAPPRPSEVQSYLSRLGELSAVLREKREMQRRVDGMRRDTALFSELFLQLARQHAPDLLGLPPIEGAEALLGRARQAREAGVQRVRIQDELERRRQLLGEAERRREAARLRLAALLRLSGASSLEEHLEIEVRSARRRELSELVRSLEDGLRGRSGGQLRALVDEVRGVDHDVLQSEIEELEDLLRDVDAEHQTAAREATSLQQGLLHYGTEDAADARQRAMHRRASVAHALRELLVLRAARLLLEAEMVDYARDNRSTLLARAEVLFSRLTLGKYRGLSVGLGERELVAVRSGQEVKVAELSSGTRAQLYLALRLASLEGSLSAPDPLPLVLDDLFVEFDEDRAVAAFEILGEIAQKTQVLYFTHLARDVEAADSATRGGRVFTHRLSAG
jgi:uncharacterized protein YhaN